MSNPKPEPTPEEYYEPILKNFKSLNNKNARAIYFEETEPPEGLPTHSKVLHTAKVETIARVMFAGLLRDILFNSRYGWNAGSRIPNPEKQVPGLRLPLQPLAQRGRELSTIVMQSDVAIMEEDDAVSEAFVIAPVESIKDTLTKAESRIPAVDAMKAVPKAVLYETGSFTFRAHPAAIAAFWSLAITLLLGFAITQTRNLTTNKNRRRKKTEICVRKCTLIVQDAMQDIEFATNRALETDDERRSRKNRKYKTRR